MQEKAARHSTGGRGYALGILRKYAAQPVALPITKFSDNLSDAKTKTPGAGADVHALETLENSLEADPHKTDGPGSLSGHTADTERLDMLFIKRRPIMLDNE